MHVHVAGDVTHDRLKAVACRYWGIAPPVFDDFEEQGRICYEDLQLLLLLLQHEGAGGLGVLAFVYPEEAARRAEEAELRGRLIELAKQIPGMAEGVEKSRLREEVRRQWASLGT